MKKDKVFELLKTVIMTISIALFASLALKFTSKLVISIPIAVVILGLFIFVQLKRDKSAILTTVLPATVAVGLSFAISVNIIQMIIAVLLLILLLVCLFEKEVKSPFKAVMIILIVAIILTWILPTTYYQYGLQTGEISEVGIFDILSYGNVALSYFGNVAFYILAIGAFYGVLHKIGAYRSLLDAMAEKAKGKESIILSIVIVLLAAITSVCGASLGLWIIIPFIVSFVLLIGYDKITASLVTVGSIAVGLIGTTLSSTYISSQYNVVAQNGMGVVNNILSTKATDLIFVKLAILVLGIALLIFNTLRYANKHKNSNETKKYDEIPSVNDKKARKWPIVVVIDFMFVIMSLSLTSWTSVFKNTLFDKITTAALGKYGALFGKISAFEQWGINELSSMLIIASIVLALVYKVKLHEYISNALEGIKRALKPALLIVLIYMVLVVVSYHPVVLTIVKPLLSKHLNVFTMSLTAFVTSIFNVDMYYGASSVLPYVTELITKTPNYPTIALIWQVMYGFMSLIAPTSIILIPVLSYMDISYKDWLKSNWKFLLEMLILSILALVVLIIIL